MKKRNVISVIAVLIAAASFFTCFKTESNARLSEDAKNEYTSETAATDEEWAEETDISDLDLDYKEPKNITLCLNTDVIKLNGYQKIILKNDTVYVPLRAFYEEAGFKVKMNSFTGKITLETEGSETVCGLYSKKCTVNGEQYKLNNRIIYKKGCLYAPADLISLSMNAKVWYDEDGKTFTVSTGKYIDDGILRIVNGKLYMNGEPYYEISFNKFDLCYQIHAAYYHNHEWPEAKFQHEAAEDALSQLHELGFKSLRVFVNSTYRGTALNSEEDMIVYLQAMDDLFDLCDKYEIKLVVCMNLFDGAFCTGGETWIDLVGDLSSKSFARLEKYVRLFVKRYKDRDSVLMWEITNEGNLEADLKKISARQIGNFYEAVANIIHDEDSERLVTGGDGMLRDSQWHMYECSRRNQNGNFWGNDTLKERFMAYETLYHGIDVISIHPYGIGINTNYHFVEEGVFEVVDVNFEYLAYESKVLGKPFYNGEVAVNADNPPEDNEVNEEYLNMIIDSGIQLTHWWTFHTDRQGFHDGYGWDITYGDLLDTIIEANRKIQERYCVNGCPDDTAEESAAVLKEYECAENAERNSVLSDIPFLPEISIIIAAAAVTAIAVKKKINQK